MLEARKLPEEISAEAESISSETISGKLLERELHLQKGSKEILSGGVYGSLYKFDTEEGVSVVEKNFKRGGSRRNKRYSRIEGEPQDLTSDVRSRLGVVDKESGQITKIVVDWVYNEEKALNDLEGIEGVPKSFGAVYEGTKGSIFEEYIEGFDFNFLLDYVKSEKEINEIFDKIKNTYIEAAKKGYIYNQPIGSTIMIRENDMQPYLIDWYNHCSGDIESDGPIKEKYEQGVNSIEEYREYVLSEFRSKDAA